MRHIRLSLALTIALTTPAFSQKKPETPEMLPPGVEKFEVRTYSEMNRIVPFYIRVPLH